MRYRITHRTAYTYAAPAYESFNEIRLRPLSDESQTCVDFRLSIDPPATVIAFRDYYGNEVHDFGVPYLHDHLTIEATSDVVIFADEHQPLAGPAPGEPDCSPPLASLATDTGFADEHAEFLTQSTYIGLGAGSRTMTQAILDDDPQMTALTFFLRAGEVVHNRLEYRIGTTTVHSTVAEVLTVGSGVCQDFSHLLISLCRHAGLPTRYVSGYLGHVERSVASHAWSETFIPPYGWIGLDATSGLLCTGRYVKVAVGRDYADVSVVRGTYRGGAASALDVTVESTTLDRAGRLQSMRGGGRRPHELVQFQTLGSLKQIQRIGAMSASLGSMSQHLDWSSFSSSGMTQESGAPRQQPQQQQQGTPDHAGSIDLPPGDQGARNER